MDLLCSQSGLNSFSYLEARPHYAPDLILISTYLQIILVTSLLCI